MKTCYSLNVIFLEQQNNLDLTLYFHSNKAHRDIIAIKKAPLASFRIAEGGLVC